MSEKVQNIEQLFNKSFVQTIIKEIFDSRKCVGEDNFSYTEIEKVANDKTYIIKARHISLEEALKFHDPRCKQCYGTGRKVVNIEKSRIKHINEFIMIASMSTADLSEEQKRIFVEREKLNKFWKVLLPCNCTIKNMIKKDMYIISNDMHNIVAEITCFEK